MCKHVPPNLVALLLFYNFNKKRELPNRYTTTYYKMDKTLTGYRKLQLNIRLKKVPSII